MSSSYSKGNRVLCDRIVKATDGAIRKLVQIWSGIKLTAIQQVMCAFRGKASWQHTGCLARKVLICQCLISGKQHPLKNTTSSETDVVCRLCLETASLADYVLVLLHYTEESDIFSVQVFELFQLELVYKTITYLYMSIFCRILSYCNCEITKHLS